MISRITNATESIAYFSKKQWGTIVDDDKYWDDEELLDNFIIFYVYCFAHLGLPRPSVMQLQIARYIQDRTNPHRLVWSPRGIA